MTEAPKSRKLEALYRVQWFMLAGFLIAAVGYVYSKLPVEFFATYTGGVTIGVGAYMAGNVYSKKFGPLPPEPPKVP